MTFGSLLTDGGRLKFYLGEGRFTADPIPREFFGCAGVAEIPGLQDVLLRHRQGGPPPPRERDPRAACCAPVREALEHYLGCDVSVPQGGET